MHPVLLALCSLACLITAYLKSRSRWRARTHGRPLPPGPPKLPIVGNLFNCPSAKPWYGYRDLCAQYGDIVHVRILNQDMVILGGQAAISEFLEKHTANTSDRSVTPLVRLTGIDWMLGLLPYGPKWRSYRRALWQHFHPGAIEKYRPVQLAIMRVFLAKVLQKPQSFQRHIRFLFSATVLKIGYGIDVDDETCEMIEIVDGALEAPAQALVPGRFLVDFLPFLEYVPAWVPGAGFQTQFARWRKAGIRLRDLTYDSRNKAFTPNTIPGTTPIVDVLISRLSGGGNEWASNPDQLIKDVLAVAFEAGADTTFATLLAVLLAMTLYPEVQQKAQNELDAVVGRKRLPDFDDRDSLVYVNAVCKEALRWHNVTPVSIPHRTIHDDEFRGFFIPAGTVLLPNIWACMHDPDVYEDPGEFRPERFLRDGKLDPTVRDPFNFVFGSGRRICPGRYFADSGLYLSIACLLHVFRISPPVDESGEPIRIEPKMTDGFVSYVYPYNPLLVARDRRLLNRYPEDCRCVLQPRFSEVEALLTNTQTRT